MRIICYAIARRTSFGIVTGRTASSISAAAALADISAVLARRRASGACALRRLPRRSRVGAVTVLPAVPDPPRKVLCVGLNYRAHVAESAGREVPEHPRIFSRLDDSVIGHGAAAVAAAQLDAFRL